jgi:hypothetical protein
VRETPELRAISLVGTMPTSTHKESLVDTSGVLVAVRVQYRFEPFRRRAFREASWRERQFIDCSAWVAGGRSVTPEVAGSTPVVPVSQGEPKRVITRALDRPRFRRHVLPFVVDVVSERACL